MFYKYSIKDKKIPLILLTLKIGNKVTEETPSIKSLRVMLDENASWRYHTKTVENNYQKI